MNLSNYSFCHYAANGEVKMYGTCAQIQLQYQEFPDCTLAVLGQNFIVPVEPHYMAAGEILAPCVDYDMFSIPLPCTISIEGVVYSVTEPPTFTFDAPGSYDLFVKPADAQYRDKVLTIEY